MKDKWGVKTGQFCDNLLLCNLYQFSVSWCQVKSDWTGFVFTGKLLLFTDMYAFRTFAGGWGYLKQFDVDRNCHKSLGHILRIVNGSGNKFTRRFGHSPQM